MPSDACKLTWMSSKADNLQPAAACNPQFCPFFHFLPFLKIIFTYAPQNCTHVVQKAILSSMQYLQPRQDFLSRSTVAQIMLWCSDKAEFHSLNTGKEFPTGKEYSHGQPMLTAYCFLKFTLYTSLKYGEVRIIVDITNYQKKRSDSGDFFF